ncbi:Acyl-CoA N-acyltransferase [Niveomyces insectorum RCEF 264]|uniref:Acyl-CoA N-acyltransferase n=1 Tax=Niveomyces insectorum RCEF 264 TaxID=1081102 RepID=A0A167P3W5_9HYPO|nr:Acyl-CoA N-acyltransferase [Niveomyces insectorum RCEF 264]
MSAPAEAPVASDAEPPTPDTPLYTINTPRLILRSPVPADADAVSALFADEANFPFDPPQQPTPTPADYRKRFARWHAAAIRGESAFMVVERREDGTIIGFGGWNGFEYQPAAAEKTEEDEVSRNGDDKPAAGDGATTPQIRVGDTGIVIDHRHWRSGYAREAFCATVESGFTEQGLARVVLDTAKENYVWRTFMRDGLGLAANERTRPSGRKKDDWEYAYAFDQAEWEAAKQALRAQGKWPL